MEPVFGCMVPEGVGVLGISSKLNQAGKKKAITCMKVSSLTEQHQDLLLVSH